MFSTRLPVTLLAHSLEIYLKRGDKIVRQLIYIYKSPNSAKRIGFIYSSSEPNYPENLPDTITDLITEYDLSIHHIKTKERSIDSIIEADPFFDEIDFFHDAKLFSKELKKLVDENKLTAVEFSRIILSRYDLNKRELQRVLCLTYAECLNHGIKFFNNSPVLYGDEPVFEEVYVEYNAVPASEKIKVNVEMSERSKFSKARQCSKIIKITKSVVNKCFETSHEDLFNISPTTSYKYQEGEGSVISNEVILKTTDKILNELYT